MRGPFDEQADDPSSGEKLGVPRSEASGGFETLAVGRLKRRADFLHAGKGKRWHGKALSLRTGTRDASITSRGAGVTSRDAWVISG